MTTTNNTNGFEGVAINVTIENEITKRVNELNEMNMTSNWTTEMVAREVILDNEIQDLIDARLSYQNA